MPAIVEGGGGPGLAGIPTDLDTRLYGKVAGVFKRKTIPPITSLDFELIERGGMGSGSFSLPCAWEDLSLDGTEFIDVRLFGQADPIIYRGFVQIPTQIVESVEVHNAELQSIIGYTKYMVRWSYAYGGGADLAIVAADLLADFVSGPSDRLGAYLTTDLQTTGITVTEFDATGRSVWQAFNMLVDKAPGLVIWGVEAGWSAGPPGTPQHRIYLRPRPDVTGKYYSIGGNISGFTYPKDVGSIVNVINLIGGPVQQPNLCNNPSFEEVGPVSETIGNLLLDSSFEDNDAAWTLTGARKFTGMDATAVGSPKDGKYWLELDQNTESGIQVVLAPFSVIYTGSAWIRREGSAATQVKLTLEGLNAADGVVVTADTGFVTPSGKNWEKISVDLDPTAASTVVKIRFRVETNGGSASNDGVLVDFVALVEKNGEGSVGWRRIVAGIANASTFQWNYKPAVGAFHGGYVVRSDPSAIAGAGDYVEIRVTKDKRIEVQPNERHSFLVWFYVVNPADVALGIIEYDGNGSNVATNISDTSTLTVVGWQTVQFYTAGVADGPGLTMNANTRSVELLVRHMDNDEVLIDGVFFCQGDFPEDLDIGVLSSGEYWAGENYEKRMKTSDAAFTGGYALDAAADTSIADYGEREDEVQNELVTDLTTALTFGQDYFNSFAIPSIMANLRVERLMRVGELLTTADDRVKIVNLPSAPAPLNPVRVSYTIRGDAIDFTADLGNEMPTMDALLRYVQGRTKVRGF